jgi:N-formylglutamate amidohydrolase
VDVFDLKVGDPSVPERPLLVEIPHAGLIVPEAIRHELLAPEDALMRDADIYVDRLYENSARAGATLLVAKLSRYVVDLNRARDDLDAATVSGHPVGAGTQPRGVVWRATTDGRPVLLRPLGPTELNSRLERYYAPYHKVLQLNLDRLRDRFGYVILLAAHSMPSLGRSTHRDPGAQRADVVPGTCGRTSADPRVIDFVDAHFRNAGLRVRHDDPYKGGYTTSHYGRPAQRCHAIQIELNRALYVDEQTFRIKQPEFDELQRLLDSLVTSLAALKL